VGATSFGGVVTIDEGNHASQGAGIHAIGTVADNGGRVQSNAAIEVPGSGGIFNDSGRLVGGTCDEVVSNTPDDLLDGTVAPCP
jgi:hypothetical protein